MPDHGRRESRDVCPDCGGTLWTHEEEGGQCANCGATHPDLREEGGNHGVVGFTPRMETDPWTVRRCPIHELVTTDDDYCPVMLDQAACGLKLSASFLVVEANRGANREP